MIFSAVTPLAYHTVGSIDHVDIGNPVNTIIHFYQWCDCALYIPVYNKYAHFTLPLCTLLPKCKDSSLFVLPVSFLKGCWDGAVPSSEQNSLQSSGNLNYRHVTAGDGVHTAESRISKMSELLCWWTQLPFLVSLSCQASFFFFFLSVSDLFFFFHFFFGGRETISCSNFSWPPYRWVVCFSQISLLIISVRQAGIRQRVLWIPSRSLKQVTVSVFTQISCLVPWICANCIQRTEYLPLRWFFY